MRITSIEKQKKEGRYNIFLDGEFSFGVYKETVYKFGLRINDELSEKKTEEIKRYDEIQFAKKVAFRYLSYKPRTEKEVIKKLREKMISTSSINTVMNFLKELNYINDEEYSKRFLESTLRLKPSGKRNISLKLRKKGISREITDKILKEEYKPDNETSKAIDVYRKYLKKLKAKSSEEKKQKCFRYLISKGFDYETVREVMKINEKE